MNGRTITASSNAPISYFNRYAVTTRFPTTAGRTIVELTEQELIGKGTRRLCYEFPGDPAYCIKIPKGKKNGVLQQRREVKYYEKLQRRGISTDLITNYHGSIETSLGKGYVYDAVRDEDGSVSRQLALYLREQPEDYQEYLRLLREIEAYLFENQVLFYDLNTWNILCRKSANNTFEPYIIDGVGDVVAIPVLNLSRALVLQKIRRRWMRFIRKMTKRFDWMSEYRLSH